MDAWFHALRMALILLVILPLIILAVYWRFGKGLAFRIFLYVIPLAGFIAVLSFIQGRANLSLNTGLVLMAFGAAVSAGISVLLYRATVVHLEAHVRTVQASSNQLAATATQAAATAAQLSSMVRELSVAAEEMLQTSKAASTAADEVVKAAGHAAEHSREGQHATIAALRILELIGQTGAIVETVNSLAEQSNLLAVNASIEAAKAGDSGRGFAVVAAEVRNLSDQSKDAARRIREAIQRSDEGKAAVRTAATLIERLSAVVDDTSSRAHQIAASSAQQLAGIDQITRSIGAVEQGGRETADAARQIEDAASLLQRTGLDLGMFISGSKAATEAAARH